MRALIAEIIKIVETEPTWRELCLERLLKSDKVCLLISDMNEEEYEGDMNG